MNIILRRFDRGAGSYDYVEYDPVKNVYQTGDTAINEHYNQRAITININTYKELENFERQLIGNGVENELRYGITSS